MESSKSRSGGGLRNLNEAAAGIQSGNNSEWMLDMMDDEILVCMRQDNNLVYVDQDADSRWQLQIECDRSGLFASPSLRPQALFCIVKQGHYVCIQSLGAEGRLVEAHQDPKKAHTLTLNISDQALWRVHDGTLVNASWRHKDLGFTVEQVTALPTAELAKVERDHHESVTELQHRLRRLELEAGGDERGLGHLRWSSDSSSQTSLQEREIDELRQQLEATRRDLNQVKEEAEAALLERDEQHETVIKHLLDERQRLDSALHFIRGMTEEGIQNLLTEEEGGDNLNEQEMPAIGIPITRTSSENASPRLLSPAPLQEISPAPKSNSRWADKDVAGPSQSRTPFRAYEEEDFEPDRELALLKARSNRLNITRLSWRSSSSSGWTVNTHNNENRSIDTNRLSGSQSKENPNSNLVDYHGNPPNLVTEQSLDRILDAPFPGALEEERSLPCLHAEYSEEATPCAKNSRPPLPSGDLSAPASTSKNDETSPTGVWPLGTFSLPCSQTATPTDVTAATSIAQSSGVYAGPQTWLTSEDSYEVREVAQLDATKAIKALQDGSPQAANLLTQYLATSHKVHRQSYPQQETRRNTKIPSSVDNLHKKSSFLTRAPIDVHDLFG